MHCTSPRRHKRPTLWLTATAALLALVLQAAPAAAQAKKVITIEGITEYQLPNGVRFLLVPDQGASTVTVNVTVLVGSRHEGYGETGMAHLLEHMVFKGTPNHPELFKMLQSRGASFNGTTWFDRTNYYETLPATDDNLKFAIEMEADRLVNSFVKREDLVKEMTVVRNEFEMNENNPAGVLRFRMYAAAYEWHNYGKVTIGNRSDIERVPIDRLQAFYKKHYQPDNIVLTVGGKIDEAKTIDLIVKSFGAIPRPKRALDKTYTEEPAQDGERTVMLRRVGKTSTVGFMYHVPSTAHADFGPLDLLESVLLANPAGRLYKKLVEGKKATSISGGTGLYHDPGVFSIMCNVADESTPEEVRKLIIAEMENFKKQPVTKEELDRARQSMLADYDRKLDNKKALALELSEWIAAGDWRLLFVHRERLKTATLADLNRAAEKYFRQTNRTVGIFIPSKDVVRAEIPQAPAVTDVVKDFKGGAGVTEGEAFDPSPENIEKRLTRSKLTSGIKVALLPKKTTGESVVANLTLRFGNEKSLFDYQDAAGFMGRLMTRGTKKYTAQQLTDEMDKLGATMSVSSSLGSLTVSLKAKRKTLPQVLELVREVLREPTFPKDEFDIALRSSKQALERAKADPFPLAGKSLMRKLSPYPKDDIRYQPTIEEALARLDKVTTEQIGKLYKEQLGATVGELVIIGDFDPEPTVKQFETILAGWKTEVPYQRIPTVANVKVPGSKENILTPDKENAIFLAGFLLQMQDTDPDYLPLRLGNYVLGSGGASRLFDRLRVKDGLSYGAGSFLQVSPQDKMTLFAMQAICKPENMDKADKAVQEEVQKILKEGLSEEDLQTAKKSLLQELKVARGSDGSLLGQLSSGLVLGRTMDYYAKQEKAIEALTLEDVNRALRANLVPGRLVIIRAGDFNKGKSTPK